MLKKRVFPSWGGGNDEGKERGWKREEGLEKGKKNELVAGDTLGRVDA